MMVILGGGLAGLSTALHLENLPWRIYEAEKEVGGLCRSMSVDGFTFDYTGHLLYLHHEPVKELFRRLMVGKMHAMHRSAWIHSHGALVHYPYQVNTRDLPVEVRVECITEFVKARMEAAGSPGRGDARLLQAALDFLELKVPREDVGNDLEQWVLRTFGEGFARHFFRPYNEKLWRRPLKDMTAEWTLWSVPVPDLEEVLRGAMGLEKKTFGYNASFLYPRDGGIRTLPDTLAGALDPGDRIHLGKRAVSVEAEACRVRFEDGEEAEYEWLVSSIPLNRLVERIVDAPVEVRRAAAVLKAVSVYGVNLGVKGGGSPGRHWTYFPEGDYPFYRVGYISNYAPGMAPEGYTSLTAEVARRPDEPDVEGLEGLVVDGLVRSGVIQRAGDVALLHTVRIDPAYVVFDRERQTALPLLFDYLMSRRIMPVGRYGTWNYLGMEDSLLHGMQAAAHLKAEHDAGGG